MSDVVTTTPKPHAVSGGQLFVLGLVLGLVAGALISAFVTPLIQTPGISIKAPAPGSVKPGPGTDRDDRPSSAQPATNPASTPDSKAESKAEPTTNPEPAQPSSAAPAKPAEPAPSTPK